MHLIFRDRKKGVAKVKMDTLDDLWYLSIIVREGDTVSGNTTRVVDFGGEQEKKPVWIKMKAEKIEFSPYTGRLRISGTIIEGRPEDFVQIAKHHSFDLAPDDIITIEKDWLSAEWEKLEEAVEESKKPKAFIILIDDRKALIAKAVSYGVEVITEMESGMSKKMSEKDIEKTKKNFYETLKGYVEKEKLVILAGPGFERENLSKFLRAQGYRTATAQATSAEISGINEIIESGIVKDAVGMVNREAEKKLLDEFVSHAMREDGLASYGAEQLAIVASNSAVGKLLVLDTKLRDLKTRELMKKVEKGGGRIHIFSSKSPEGEKLEGFGGVAAVLRFAVR